MTPPTTSSPGTLFVTGISGEGHGITYTLGKIKETGGVTRPIYFSKDGSPQLCSFSISAKNNGNEVLTDANIIFYVGA